VATFWNKFEPRVHDPTATHFCFRLSQAQYGSRNLTQSLEEKENENHFKFPRRNFKVSKFKFGYCQFCCLPAGGDFVAIATLEFERGDFTLRGDNQSRLFRASVGASAHFAAVDHHVGDGHGNWEDLHFLNDHRLAGIRPDGFDDFAVIFLEKIKMRK
jgi:hypothetical protein